MIDIWDEERRCAYLEVMTITTPYPIKFSSSRRNIIASAMSVTLMPQIPGDKLGTRSTSQGM